jgi:outer membrane protein TolC
VTERLPLHDGHLGNCSDWQSRAEANSPQLLASIKTAEAARYEVHRVRAGHLPTIDLVALIGRSQSDTVTSIGQSYNTRQIGVQISVPLFSGGQTSSSDRQAVATHEKFLQQAETARRELLNNIGKEYDTVTQGAVKIRAAEQAFFAASKARSSTEKGVLAGTRNNIDVLNAQQQELSARINAMRSKYEFVSAWLRLNALAGGLSENQLETTSRWLAENDGLSR